MVTIKTGLKLKNKKGIDEETTVGDFVSDVLFVARQDQGRCAKLAHLFCTQESVELKTEDIVFIKEKLASLGVMAIYYAQIESLLESEEAQ